jgi:hypothetical protein
MMNPRLEARPLKAKQAVKSPSPARHHHRLDRILPGIAAFALPIRIA